MPRCLVDDLVVTPVVSRSLLFPSIVESRGRGFPAAAAATTLTDHAGRLVDEKT